MALWNNIIGTNLLTKFHGDRKINATFKVLTRKNAPPRCGHTINVASRVHIGKNAPNLGSHVFQAKVTIFELIQDIIGTNFLTKFHEDRKINVASRVLTRKNAQPPDGHVFQPTGIIFKVVQDITEMNLLTKFHEDQTINVASRVNNAPTLGSYTNLLTKFHEHWTINMASRELTMQMCHIRQNAPPPGHHVFQPTCIIFKVVQDIIEMNLLTKFHEDHTINVASRVKNAPPLGSHFHEDRKINVTSIVKKAPPPGDIIGINLLTKKNTPLLGSHVFQANVTIFKLIQDITETYLLTKFHEHWK
ncbi:hypothetical protein DPMN_002590 [Dreissena polymorpha]|uniref:Uncharacterized protein n=1 Tax=Dreissena polymorpha TaxID=45954 RepID=A0A9D4MJE4_DREPO|nr:hypothetical protein DPMN_002590 [Dreissena polymorpha]